MRNRRKQLIERAQTARDVPRDIQNENGVLVRVMLKEPVKVGALQREDDGILQRPHRSTTRKALDDAHFAEELLWTQVRENCFVRFSQMFHDLDAALLDDKHTVACFFFPDDGLARMEGGLFDGLGDHGQRGVIKPGKDRDAFQKMLTLSCMDHGGVCNAENLEAEAERVLGSNPRSEVIERRAGIAMGSGVGQVFSGKSRALGGECVLLKFGSRTQRVSRLGKRGLLQLANSYE